MMINDLRTLFTSALLVLLSLLPSLASAQGPMPDLSQKEDSVKLAILPAASYSSDLGILGGLIFNRLDRRGSVTPFRNHMEALMIASTKGYLEFYFKYDGTQTLGRPFRSIAEFEALRVFTNNYFGVGNQTTFSENRWDNEYYYFESFSFAAEYRARKRMWNTETRNKGTFDAMGIVGLEFEKPLVRNENSELNLNPPNGMDGGFVNYLGAGFVWENRNNEFYPSTGNRLEGQIWTAPALLGSDFPMTRYKLEAQQYFRLIKNRMVLANRLRWQHALGDVPYWELPVATDGRQLRGYPLNRFMGRASISYTAELRSWIFELPLDSRFGMHAFTDIGRVFTEQHTLDDAFTGYKQTFGIGAAVSLLSPEFILRGELGRSEDLYRFYVGIGYSF
ncbi:MAG: BamA/TamA family outer membrane protein [Bacteroidota bacterium]